MTKNDNLKPFPKDAFYVNTSLLIIHVYLMVFFLLVRVKFMFCFNILSVIFYGLCYLLIQKKVVAIYILLILFEIGSHMVAATICCGWNCGFHLYSFGIVSAIYYTYYSYITQKGAKSITIFGDTLGVLLFIVLKIVSLYIEPVYQIKPWIQTFSYLVNGLIIFGFCISSLHKFTHNAVTREQDLQMFADYDELTKLFNRHKMREILDCMQQDAESEHNSNYCTAIIDIDDFKQINDKYGHSAGDKVLSEVGKIIQKTAEDNKGYACRWGGEEFLLTKQYNSSDKDQEADCTYAAIKLHKAISDMTVNCDGKKIRISTTIGLSFHFKGEAIESTIRRSDLNLYRGKNAGKNKVISDYD